MSACYEIETEIPLNHQLVVQLPDSIPAGHAKITIHYDLLNLPATQTQMTDFLNNLPELSPIALNRETIQQYLEQERQSWDN